MDCLIFPFTYPSFLFLGRTFLVENYCENGNQMFDRSYQKLYLHHTCHKQETSPPGISQAETHLYNIQHTVFSKLSSRMDLRSDNVLFKTHALTLFRKFIIIWSLDLTESWVTLVGQK